MEEPEGSRAAACGILVPETSVARSTQGSTCQRAAVRRLMSDAKLTTEQVIRAAKSSDWASSDRDETETISVGDTSFRHTDIDTAGGGGSRLTKKDIGSSALMAALTLHPCVHISGCGDASILALQTVLTSVGECRVVRELDEDGYPTGEASATYGSAAEAVAAISRFDGTRFDDGVLQLSVSKRSAQGSLTTRGRGRGRGKDGMTFHDKQQDMIGRQMAERAQSEKDAFAAARSAALSPGVADGPVAGPALPSRRPAGVEPAAKRTKPSDGAPSARGRLPGGFVVQRAVAPTSSVGATDESKTEAVSTREVVVGSGGLLGLAGYGDSDSDSDSKQDGDGS